MDLIREHLIYKEVPVTICMRELKPIEQYEVIRCLLATRTKDVSICTHESTNEFIEKLLKDLPVKFVQCFRPVELVVAQEAEEERQNLHSE
jgi:hypothetical protein